MTDCEDVKTRSDLIKAIKKPGKVYVTMCIKNDIARVAVEKSSLLEWLSNEPEDDCSVFGFYENGVLIIDAQY